MTRSKRLLHLTCVAMLFLNGCGGSFVVLEIDASLQAPEEVDLLEIITFDAEHQDVVLAQLEQELTGEHQFPLRVLLQPSDDTPERLRHHVTASLSGAAVAEAEVVHQWYPGETSLAAFELDLIHEEQH